MLLVIELNRWQRGELQLIFSLLWTPKGTERRDQFPIHPIRVLEIASKGEKCVWTLKPSQVSLSHLSTFKTAEMNKLGGKLFWVCDGRTSQIDDKCCEISLCEAANSFSRENLFRFLLAQRMLNNYRWFVVRWWLHRDVIHWSLFLWKGLEEGKGKSQGKRWNRNVITSWNFLCCVNRRMFWLKAKLCNTIMKRFIEEIQN